MPDDLTLSLDLMRQAQEGDEAALNRLLTRYYDRVRPIVRARLGKRLRRHVDSGDILQETFETACRTFSRFDVTDEASLIGWLADLGVNWDAVNQQEGNTVPRWHHPEGGGKKLWQMIYDAALAQGVDHWLTNTAATELIIEKGRVTGLRVQRRDTSEILELHGKDTFARF